MDRIDGLQYDPQDYPRYGEAPYVGLGQLLGKIQEAMAYSHGNGVESCKVNLLERTVALTCERTVYTASGYHCRTETYTATLYIRKLPCGYVIFPEEMDVEWEAAQPERTYTRSEAIEFLDEMFDGKWPHEGVVWRDRLDDNPTDDDIVSMAHQYGLSEGDYAQPDDSFAWQHLDHFLEQWVNEIKAEREKLHADAELRREGIRSDLTKEQLGAIRQRCMGGLASSMRHDAIVRNQLARRLTDSYGLAEQVGTGGGDALDWTIEEGFNPWIEQASDGQK